MLPAIYLMLTLVLLPALIIVAARRHARQMEQAIDRAVWPWASAYLELRDERDTNGS